MLKGLESEFGIKIEIKQGPPLIEVVGLKKRVDQAEFKIYKYLKTDFRKWRYRDTMVGLIKKTVQWHYDDSKKCTMIGQRLHTKHHTQTFLPIKWCFYHLLEPNL